MLATFSRWNIQFCKHSAHRAADFFIEMDYPVKTGPKSTEGVPLKDSIIRSIPSMLKLSRPIQLCN